MLVEFTKMEALGNDFIVINSPGGQEIDWPGLAPFLCNRRLGIGADGLLIVGPSDRADFKMRIINADGSEAEMCGNGIRCAARYAQEAGFAPGSQILVETLAGLKQVSVEGNMVRVDMGEPILRPELIPISPPTDIQLELELEGTKLGATCVSMGNPHCIIFVPDIHSFPVQLFGPQIETHPRFPQRTNVEFAEVVRPDYVRVRVWERGVGETPACGTGACATVVAGALANILQRSADVHLPGGILHITWEDDNRVTMVGPANFVFTGRIDTAR